MSIPQYIDSSTGTQVAGTVVSLGVTFPTGITSADLAVLFMVVRGDSGGTLTTSSSYTFNDIMASTLVGAGSSKVMARYHVCDGSESSQRIEIKNVGTAGRRGAILHHFRGDSGSWNFENISYVSNASSTTHNNAGVSVSGNQRLLINLNFWVDAHDQLDDYTGETGGTWTKASHYATGNNPQLDMFVCSLTGSGSISNGVVNLLSGPTISGIIGFAIWAVPTNMTPSGETSPEAFGGLSILCPLGYNP